MVERDTRTDEALVEDYLDGDVGAFRELIERYHDGLVRFLHRMCSERSLAEDVFQETFLQVHQSLETFDTSRRFKPWLFTIAANKARDALRSRQRRSAVSLDAPVGAGDEGVGLVDLLEVDTASPAAGLDREDLARLVQEAVDDLSPRLREILLLAYFQKMSYAQLSEVLGVPLGTVKSRLHAAVAAFAKAWEARSKSAREGGEESGGSARTRGGGAA